MTHSQGLSFDQLIHLNGLSRLDMDAYLAKRGWKFNQTVSEGDSIFKAYWFFNNMKQESVGQIELRSQVDHYPYITYSCADRITFDAIRAKIAAYHMQYQGDINRDEGLTSIFMGAKYRAQVSVTNSPSYPDYHVTLQVHGLIRGYQEDLDTGEMKDIWIDPRNISFEQVSDSADVDRGPLNKLRNKDD
ncbi:hypothetical protein [Hymenobacter sediminicola]|uniref:Uncharacterized protein n=1 Tax=Hymenobacter sediminicola TaxID=2761579 RepID=A0A7G7W757_9BACT|nr:hypothetical protein [Hymenobacter sediminicola]QNH62200.1 hypothetical protein H4317_19015 [Hymenobacter sediminicola]